MPQEIIKEKTSNTDEIIVSANKKCYLLLWNDNKNYFDYVVETLCDECQLTYETSYRVMLVAHTEGNSIVKQGSWAAMMKMKSVLSKKNLTASVETITEGTNKN